MIEVGVLGPAPFVGPFGRPFAAPPEFLDLLLEPLLELPLELRLDLPFGNPFGTTFSTAFGGFLSFLFEWVCRTATNKSNPTNMNLTAITPKVAAHSKVAVL